MTILAACRTLSGSHNSDLSWSGVLQRNSAPINLTGYVGQLQAREYEGAPDPPYISLATNTAPTTNGSSLTFPTPLTGAFAMLITIADLAAFPVAPQAAYYDLLLTDTSGVTQRYVFGQIVLVEGVTVP